MDTSHTKNVRGFSIVELMVGLVISMVVSLAVFQTFGFFEAQKRSTTSGADAQMNGLVALQSLERDLKMAGDGLATDWLQACAFVYQSYSGASIPNFSLASVSIIDGGGAATDRIIVRRGNSMRSGGPLKLVADMTGFNSPLHVINPVAFFVGDQIIVADKGAQCTLAEISAITQLGGGDAQLQLAAVAANPFNSAAAPASLPAGGTWVAHPNTAQIFNLGNLLLRTYDVNANTLRSVDFPAAAPIPVASDIVQLQAQYGVDQVGNDEAVDCWTNASGGCGLPGTPTLAQSRLIKAVRVAVVARSPQKEKPNPTSGLCDATPSGAWPATGRPVWGGAALLDVSATDADWRCFRYRVYETVVPLRNVIWGNVSNV